ETIAGVITAELKGDLVRLAMSTPQELLLKRKANVNGKTITVHSLNTGVPHAVVLVNGLHDVAVKSLGSALRHHEEFAPRGTNVNFVQFEGANQIAIRTYERGVEDETLACGTGVVASALIANEIYKFGSPVRVKVQGGDTMEVSFVKEDDSYRDVT